MNERRLSARSARTCRSRVVATGRSVAAQTVGFETVQLFTKNNNQWNAPPLTDEHVTAFQAALDRDGNHPSGRTHVVPDQPRQSG